MAMIAAGVAVGSVVVNDYFDYLVGVDSINAPDRPLPSGIIRPDIALLITLLFYVAVLVAGCLMEPPALRSRTICVISNRCLDRRIIAFSATGTLLYTPFLKSLTLVKNVLVASITALSPISGALAAGTGSIGVQKVMSPSLFLLGAILFREILMDIGDVEGDRIAGLYTIPVLLGRTSAFFVALLFLSVGTVLGGRHLPNETVMHFLAQHVPSASIHVTMIVLFAVAVLPLYSCAFRIWRYGFDKTLLQTTIDRAIAYTAFGLLFVVLFG